VLQGRVLGLDIGMLEGCPGMQAAALTGASTPDFVVNSHGANMQYASVIARVGGSWRALSFEQGYAMRNGAQVQPGSDGGPQISGRDMLTATGSGMNLHTFTWEAFEHGAFRPVAPPDGDPPCDPQGLDYVLSPAEPGGSPALSLQRASCADGWALAVGGGPLSSRIVALFTAVAPFGLSDEEPAGSWITIALDDGSGLGYEPGNVDVPLPLLVKLAPGSGQRRRPRSASECSVSS
jgi:hypothetical protein